MPRDSESIKGRLILLANHLQGKCSIPDCGRPTMRAAGLGLSEFHCRYHVQFRARHGSHWCPTYKATDIKPYLASAAAHIKEHREETFIAHAILGLQGLLDGSGPALPVQDTKSRSATFRSRVAFARLREAGVEPQRLLANHMAVTALMADDAGSHRVQEFQIVQIAKAAHRLASGTHRHWEWPLQDGTFAPLEFHAYPKSSGRVLRIMGKEIDEICAGVTERDLQTVRDRKMALFGPHPSRLPGWKPLWQRKREVAQNK